MLPIEILMQAVVVAFAVFEQQGSGFVLPSPMTASEELLVFHRKAYRNLHLLIPAVGDYGEFWVKPDTHLSDEVWQRIPEIFVLALSETVTSHHDATAEPIVVRVQRRNAATLFPRKKVLQAGTAKPIKICGDRLPIQIGDAEL